MLTIMDSPRVRAVQDPSNVLALRSIVLERELIDSDAYIGTGMLCRINLYRRSTPHEYGASKISWVKTRWTMDYDKKARPQVLFLEHV